jgi:hypothetical protein
MSYRDRRLARAERLREWAEKRTHRATGRFDRAHNLGRQLDGDAAPITTMMDFRPSECGEALASCVVTRNDGKDSLVSLGYVVAGCQ